MDRGHALRFSLVFLVTALAVVGLVAGFNAVVDPFAMYRAFEVEGFNADKPATYQRVRLLKAYELRRLKPEAVVLGSSRSHIAIRPSHEGWNVVRGARYSIAFDGATTKEMYHYLLHAHANRPLKQVVLGLDGYHPGFGAATTRPGFDPALLDEPGSPFNGPRRVLADLRLLASVDTLRASIDTLRAQADAAPRWLAADGQRLGDVFFHKVGGTFLSEGPRAYFDEIDCLEIGFQTEWQRPATGSKARAPVATAVEAETAFGYIRRIVAFCRAEGIDLRLFITPAHAHQLEIAAAVGGWSQAAENGKRALVDLLAQDAAAHPGAAPFPLYDFSGYTALTTEPPPAGSRSEMAGYWDSSHFKENVGDLVLDRVFGVAHPDRKLPQEFGVRLTAGNIEPALARIRADRAAYRARNAPEIATLESWVAQALGKPATSPAATSASGTPQQAKSPPSRG